MSYSSQRGPPSSFSVGSFNVRGLGSDFKKGQLAEDLRRYKVQICTLQETKLQDGLDDVFNDYRVLCLPSTSRHYGLGFAIHTSLQERLHRVWSESDRVAVLHLRKFNQPRYASWLAISTPNLEHLTLTTNASANMEEEDKTTVAKSSLISVIRCTCSRVTLRFSTQLDIERHGQDGNRTRWGDPPFLFITKSISFYVSNDNDNCSRIQDRTQEPSCTPTTVSL